MPTVDQIGLIVRLMAAVVWTPILYGVVRGHTAGGTYLRRILITGPFVFVLWTGALRAAQLVGIVSGDWTTILITAAYATAFVAGVTLLTTDPAA